MIYNNIQMKVINCNKIIIIIIIIIIQIRIYKESQN